MDRFACWIKNPRGLVCFLYVTILWTCLTQQVGYAVEFEQGLKAYYQGNLPLAIQYFQETLAVESTHTEARYYLATALLQLNRLSEASKQYSELIALFPDSEAAKLARIGLSEIHGEPSRKQLARSFSTTKTVEGVVGDIGASSGSSSDADGLSGLSAEKGGSKENYYDKVSEDGQTMRWSTRMLPLKLYVDKHPTGLRNFEPGFPLQVERALSSWCQVLGNKLRFVSVATPDAADIQVSWVNSLNQTARKSATGTGQVYTAGVTAPVVQDKRLKSMRVRLATLDVDGKPLQAARVYDVALHELGHALGIRGHSTEKADVMFAEKQDGDHVQLTQRDINTIRLLYSRPVDVSNAPGEKPVESVTALKERGQKLDKAIQAKEVQAKASDSYLDWYNLGALCFQKLAVLEKQSAFDSEQRGLLKKALSAYTQSIRLENKNPDAYFSRAVTYEKLQNYEQALQDIDQTLRLNAAEGKYYLEKARILTNLKRKAEAQNALNEYQIRDPQAARSADAQQIKARLKAL